MGRKIVYTCAILVIVLGFESCGGKRKMVKKEEQKTPSEGLMQRLSEQELDYQNIEIKYSTKAKLDDRKYALNITYRNQKDEILWVSVRAMLGIEAARLVAKRDSVWVISKIGQIEEKGTWKEMSSTIGYPLDFVSLQNIITRKLFYPGSKNNNELQSYLKRDQGKAMLLVPDFEDQDQREDVSTFGFLPQFIIDKNKAKLNSTRLVPEDNEWMLEVKYQEDTEDNMGLGKILLIRALDTQSDMNMDLKIQQVKINGDLKYPFQWF